MCLNTSTKHSPTETQLAVIAINRVTAWPAAVLYHRHGVDRRRGDPENEVLTLITLLGICKKDNVTEWGTRFKSLSEQTEV